MYDTEISKVPKYTNSKIHLVIYLPREYMSLFCGIDSVQLL